MSKIESRNESLSCFMDGELGDHAAILDTLSGCNETKSCWWRYHLIRETLRDSRFVGVSTDFSKRIMQALEHEPVIFSPIFSRYRTTFRQHMLKPVAGLVIAASVAAITVVTMQTFYMPDPYAGTNVASNTSPLYPAVSSGNNSAFNKLPVAAERQQDEDFNAYLMEHMEHSATGHVQGMMPYVRLAGFEDNQ